MAQKGVAAAGVGDASPLIESLRNADFSCIMNPIITSLYIDTGAPQDEATHVTFLTSRPLPMPGYFNTTDILPSCSSITAFSTVSSVSDSISQETKAVVKRLDIYWSLNVEMDNVF
jgi:hypothetical protein